VECSGTVEFPAEYEHVSRLLRKLWELKPVQQVEVGPSQLGRLDLLEPGNGPGSGMTVSFHSSDGKELAALLVGKPHMRKVDGEGGFPTGRYVKALKEVHECTWCLTFSTIWFPMRDPGF